MTLGKGRPHKVTNLASDIHEGGITREDRIKPLRDEKKREIRYIYNNNIVRRRSEDMEKKKIICLFLFGVLILVFSSCHSRQISDIKPAMTKEKVISLWGATNLITYKN